MSESILSAAERGPECPFHSPPIGDLRTMAESIIAGVVKKKNPQGYEYSVTGSYRVGLSEPYEVAKAYLSTPSWQDRPTGPGRWMKRSGIVVMVVPNDMGQRRIEQWPGGRVYGPIPEDEQQEGSET